MAASSELCRFNAQPVAKLAGPPKRGHLHHDVGQATGLTITAHVNRLCQGLVGGQGKLVVDMMGPFWVAWCGLV
jgi:hypothetical protein